MAYWAELNEENIVLRVLRGDNNDPNGDEGYQWLIDNLGGTWIKTSFNGTIRKNFAGQGYKYDEALDAFIPVKPYESWILDESTCTWVAPVPYPADGKYYQWNEELTEWIEHELS